MATRFYLPVSGTPPLSSLAVDSNWELSNNLDRLPCFTEKQNTTLTQKSANWPSTTTQQWVWRQYQSKQLAQAYSWTTSDTVSMVIKVAEAAAQVDSHLCYVIRVVSGDGATVRGTIGSYLTTSSEYPTSLASIATRIHSASSTGATNFSSQVGDRIIIEIGHHGVSPTTNTVYHNYGDPSGTSDYALTAGLTTDLCPWVELSRTVTFGTPVTTSKSAYIKGSQNIRYNSYAPFPSITVTDDFNRESLGSNWNETLPTPLISGNILSLNNGGVEWASGLSISPGIDFYFTSKNLHANPTFQHTYTDYFRHSVPSGKFTMYRLSWGFILNSSVLDVHLQKSVNDGAYNTIIDVPTQYYSTSWNPKVGVRHLSNGRANLYVDVGSGWVLKGTAVDSEALGSGGSWRIQGGGDFAGDAWIDDFGLGYVTTGDGGLPAYISGKAAGYTVSGRKSAYVQGKASYTVSGILHAYLKGISTLNISNKICFTCGIDNRYYPSVDISSSGVWRNELKSTTNLYQSIDEPLPPNDNDYIYPDVLFTGNYYECKLANPLSTPGSGAVVLFWRGKDQTGLGSKAKVELRQGITVLASGQQTLTSTPTTYYFQLTPAQRANISNWSDLRVRIIVAS